MTQTASFDYLRARAIRLAHRLSPRAGPLEQVRVRLRGGLMSGLFSDLKGDGFHVGGQDDNDIVLLDPDLGGTRLHVTSQRSAIGALVNLRADTPGMTVGGTPIDRVGLWERLPCTVDLGGVEMELDLPNRSGAVRVTGFAYVGIVAAAALALLLFPAATPSHDMASVIQEPELTETTSGATDLTQLIEEAGLGQYLTITPGSGDTLRVAGRLPEARMTAWRDLRMGWDQRPNAAPLVSRVSTMKGLDALPPIAAVQLGTDPYILLASGRNITPGEVLTDGWTVTEIRPTSFLLSRNGEDIDIAF